MIAARRPLASSIAASLLGPWLVLLGLAAHETFGHEHRLDAHAAAALHGHEHEPGVEDHHHQAAPAGAKSWLTHASRPAVLTADPVVEVAPACSSHRRVTSQRRIPEPPTVSPPILRV